MKIATLIVALIMFNVIAVSRYQWDKNYCSDNFFVREMKNILDLNLGIFSRDTLKVLAIGAPIYVITRNACDDKLHSCFYQKSEHKNINQCPKNIYNFIHKSFIPVLTIPAVYSIFFGDEDLLRTGEVYVAGVLSIWGAKNMIKNNVELDCCMRPWNEHYDCKKRGYGGFPSGHISELVFLTWLYGAEYGLKVALPLAAYTATVFGLSISCNRHYLSQLVGGSILGAVYAIAAVKLVDKRISDCCRFKVDFEPERTCLSWSYDF